MGTTLQTSPAVLGRFRRLERQFLKPHRGAIALALAGMLAQSLLLLPIPLLQGWVVDQLVPIFEHRSAADATARVQWMIALGLGASILCYLARMGLAWKVARIMTRVSLEVVRVLTDAMHRKLQGLPIAFFDREQTGRLMARITTDVGSLLVFLNSGSLQLVSDLVLAVGVSALLLWIRWQLALIAFMAVPLFALNHRLFTRRVRELSRAVRAQVAGLYALLSERVSAVRVVRSFAQEGAEVTELDRRIDAHQALNWSAMRLGSVQNAAAILVNGIGTVSVLACGVALVGRGSMTVGDLLAFYALLAQFYNPIVRLTQFQQTMVATLVAVERISEVFEEPETLVDRPGALPIRQPRGALEFRDVSFAYRTDGPLVLERVSLEIEPGMTVGIFGASGAGKSSLLALAPRLYDLADGNGAVLFDGRDVRDLRLADLRRAVALVPQQAMLFEGTIRSNLTYACPNAPPSALRRALEIADLAAMVEGFPLGLETPVGERGFSLSGGQRQRVALARALIANPAVLLLDDCTSALDAETESRIQTALEQLLPGQTRLIVSHKVASVCRADLIVVLDRGQIVEQGTHAQLIKREGAYAESFILQSRAGLLPAVQVA